MLLDYAFRPSSYADVGDPFAAIVANIKGDMRREMVLDLLRSDIPIDPKILEDHMEPEERGSLEQSNPHWVGGEYLPDYLLGEAEIARIVLASLTRDVYSIRARRENGLLRLRLVDDYHRPWCVTPATSTQPLTLGELVPLVDTARCQDVENAQADLIGGFLEEGVGASASPETILQRATFITVSSPFYPQLQEHYARHAQTWATARARHAARPGPGNWHPQGKWTEP